MTHVWHDSCVTWLMCDMTHVWHDSCVTWLIQRVDRFNQGATHMSHGTHMNESWHTYEWVMSLRLQLLWYMQTDSSTEWHTWVMAHIGWVMAHIWMSHVLTTTTTMICAHRFIRRVAHMSHGTHRVVCVCEIAHIWIVGQHIYTCCCGVATISRLLKMIRLSRKRAL